MDDRTVFQSIPRKHVLSLAPGASVREAACAMTAAHCGSVLVVEPPAQLIGIVTERDLMTRVLARSLHPQATQLREIMTPNPVCIAPHTRVCDALVIMLERGFRHLPIVGEGGRLLGVFSIRDALPRELGTALNQAEFNEQVNDALG